MRKLWGGAFHESNDQLAERFTQSVHQDLRFWQEELICSVAHARMLGQTGIISKEDAQSLIDALEQIHDEGPEHLPTDVEDIHTAIEVRLAEILGDGAANLAIARSRNDQVAAATRLYVHNELLEMLDLIKAYQAVLLDQAERYRAALMPGFTHFQPAQPITLGFYLLAHFWAAQRNGWRAERLFEAANYSPLGACAMGGTSYAIDRNMVAAELGFTAPIPNALDAVSDRSFVLDALHVCAIVMLSLSRICQELVMFATPAFGFVTLGDSVSTGSILLPQKRNPDVAELIRGRSALAIGNWTSFAAMMKALPLGYNRDAQDDKPLLYQSFDLAKDSLRLMAVMLHDLKWNIHALSRAAGQAGTTALDLAESLAQDGHSFREAHELVGMAISGQVTRDEAAIEISLPNARESVKRRASMGGPGPKAMMEQIRTARRRLRAVGFPKPY